MANDYQPVADASDYAFHAKSIAGGSGYPDSTFAPGPTAFRPPVYPYFLGAVFAVTDNSVAAGRIANAALGVVAVGLLYLIALRLFGRRIALVAGGIAAVFPPLAFESASVLSEPVFIVVVLAAVLAALRMRTSSRVLAWSAVVGALCGVAA